jgi:redox-sensitive bicupin YhaK (pirin superfamily)
MLTIHRNENRGSATYGWLNARYSFSFASWHDPRFMGISSLRVINEDIVRPQTGFSRHSHDNMEILTYILEGTISHEDSMGNKTTITAGECQLMSAGSGISHSELNRHPTQRLHLLQIWLYPNVINTEPRYQQIMLPTEDGLTLIASPEECEGSMHIKQDACVFRVKLNTGNVQTLPIARKNGYLHLIHGQAQVQERLLNTGDGLISQNESTLTITALTDVEALWFDLI